MIIHDHFEEGNTDEDEVDTAIIDIPKGLVGNFPETKTNEGVGRKILYYVTQPSIYIISIMLLTNLISFGLGRISSLDDVSSSVHITGRGESLKPSIEKSTDISETRDKGVANQTANVSTLLLEPAIPNIISGSVVASKNGTKYHYPWCSGAKKIGEQNKITFPSIEKARGAGYLPASNCKGLK